MLFKLAEKLEAERHLINASSSSYEDTVSSSNQDATSLPSPVDSQNLLYIRSLHDYLETDPNVERVYVKSEACNDDSVQRWVLGLYPRLHELVVGNNCFQYLSELKLKGFPYLEKVSIGSNCCTDSDDGCFEISDCTELKTVKMGNCSCVHWRSFVMRNCSAQEIVMGDGCFVLCERSVFEGGAGGVR